MAVSLRFMVVLVCAATIAAGHDDSARLSERFLVDGGLAVTVSVDPNHAVNVVNRRFVSFTVDSYEITANLTDFYKRYQRLFEGGLSLEPAYFRAGGLLADSISFDDQYEGDFMMSESEFDKLYKFIETAESEMLFDLNLQMRSNGSWDSSNAEKLMKYTASKNYRVHWQLGNEPNEYGIRNNYTALDPAQIGRDYAKLKESLSAFNDEGSLLVGPAVDDQVSLDFVKRFLQTGASSIDAFTFHHYFFSGTDAAAWRYMDPHSLNSFTTDLNRIKEAMSQTTKRPIWVETASTLGREPNHTRTFMHSFMWLDMLGQAALNGVDLVFRQSFLSLFDENDVPVPEFWVTAIYKQQVGSTVLRVSSDEGNNKFRIYAHCTHGTIIRHYGLIFFYMNLYDMDVQLTIPQYANETYELSALTAGGNGDLNSREIKVNGGTQYVVGDGIPDNYPVKSNKWPLNVPKHSMGFLRLWTHVAACP